MRNALVEAVTRGSEEEFLKQKWRTIRGRTDTTFTPEAISLTHSWLYSRDCTVVEILATATKRRVSTTNSGRGLILENLGKRTTAHPVRQVLVLPHRGKSYFRLLTSCSQYEPSSLTGSSLLSSVGRGGMRAISWSCKWSGRMSESTTQAKKKNNSRQSSSKAPLAALAPTVRNELRNESDEFLRPKQKDVRSL